MKMTHLQNQNIDIRALELQDIDEIVKQLPMPDQSNSLARWQNHYAQHETGERHICVITKNERIVGYGSLLPESTYAPFYEQDCFEIVDLFIAPAEREQGLATLLITYFESIAQDEQATAIGMSVPLDASHGAAHCLAVRLGYMPDGNGVTYKNNPVVPGKQYPIDDDLVIWFVKELSDNSSEQ